MRSPTRGWAGPRADTRSGNTGAAPRTVRGGPATDSAPGAADHRPGARVSAGSGRVRWGSRGPSSGPQASPGSPGDLPKCSWEKQMTLQIRISCHSCKRQKEGAGGASPSCGRFALRVLFQGRGCARARAHGSPRLTTVCFSFLAETSRRRSWPARCTVPSTELCPGG